MWHPGITVRKTVSLHLLTGREHTRSCSPDPSILFQLLHKRQIQEFISAEDTYKLSRFMVPVKLGNHCTMLAPRMTLKKIPMKISCELLLNSFVTFSLIIQ